MKMCNCQTTKAVVKWEGFVFFRSRHRVGKDSRLGILVQKMVLVSHTCYLSLFPSLSVVYSVLIKMSPNNFIYMIVACFCVCLGVFVLLSLMDLFQPFFSVMGSTGVATLDAALD